MTLNTIMPRSSCIRPLATPPIKCPIDNLPSELLHIICTHLKPSDVANLRLASRVVAPIGLQYLVPEVHLVVAEDSFKQLAAVAQHPVVSKYVTSFFYEADTLEIINEEQWKEQVESPDYLDKVRKVRASHYMLRSNKGWFARVRAVSRHRYTKQQLKEAFRKYQELCDYQDRTYDLDKKIAIAMKQFPNLKEIALSAQVWPHKQAFENAFAPGFCTAYREDGEEWPLGLVPMRSLLLGACGAGLKIERLCCKVVNWRILSQEEKTFEDMKRSVRHLRELSLTLSTGVDQEEDAWGILQIGTCAEYLRNGRLKEFLTSALDLERLEICFASYEPVSPAQFNHVVGDFYWPSLKAVKFEKISATEKHLVGFFERNASTINDLCIGSIMLLRGQWWSVLERMRLVLKLDHVEISGSLESFSATQTLDFERGSDNEQVELREGIESFLRGDHTDQKQSLTDFLLYLWKDRPDGLLLWGSVFSQ